MPLSDYIDIPVTQTSRESFIRDNVYYALGGSCLGAAATICLPVSCGVGAAAFYGLSFSVILNNTLLLLPKVKRLNHNIYDLAAKISDVARVFLSVYASQVCCYSICKGLGFTVTAIPSFTLLAKVLLCFIAFGGTIKGIEYIINFSSQSNMNLAEDPVNFD